MNGPSIAQLAYFDGRREGQFTFVDGKLEIMDARIGR